MQSDVLQPARQHQARLKSTCPQLRTQQRSTSMFRACSALQHGAGPAQRSTPPLWHHRSRHALGGHQPHASRHTRMHASSICAAAAAAAAGAPDRQCHAASSASSPACPAHAALHVSCRLIDMRDFTSQAHKLGLQMDLKVGHTLTHSMQPTPTTAAATCSL